MDTAVTADAQGEAQVLLDLAEQAIYIAEDSPGAAERFLVAAQHAYERLATMPELGRPQPMRNPRGQALFLVGERELVIRKRDLPA